MSTRGVIARANGEGFVGRYHHWDSYPSGLGQTLYKWAQQMDRQDMLHLLLDKHPAGWSTIVGTDPSLPPGYVNSNFPTDNRPQCYCHGDRHEDIDQVLTDRNAAGAGCEYAYVFDSSLHFMTILSSYHADGEKMYGLFGMGDPKAVWRKIAVVDLDGPEPDWKHLDSK